MTYTPPSEDLKRRQTEWERENPPRHAPFEVCDCPMPWRERNGKGHCAVRNDINVER